MSEPHDVLAVVTIDQRASRDSPDLVAELLGDLNARSLEPDRVRDFERTAGDEIEGLVGSAVTVVDIALRLARSGTWSTGIGLGPVRQPLPASVRAGAGPAFQHARVAVDRAKRVPAGVALVGSDPTTARDAEAVLQLLAAVVRRRSPAGWEAVDLVAAGVSQAEVAERLGITRQAVSQRLQAALWRHELAVRPVAGELIVRAQEAVP